VNFLRTRERKMFTRTQAQDVVAVGGSGVRAPEREWLGDVATRPAHGALPTERIELGRRHSISRNLLRCA
jgi:hypothetical protein